MAAQVSKPKSKPVSKLLNVMIANQHSRYFCLFSVKASQGAPDSAALLITPGLVLPDSNRFLLLKGLIISS